MDFIILISVASVGYHLYNKNRIKKEKFKVVTTTEYFKDCTCDKLDRQFCKKCCGTGEVLTNTKSKIKVVYQK